MSYLLSVLILLLAVITLTTVAGNINPKYQIHDDESARSNGFINYQPPQKPVGLNYSPPPPPRHVAPRSKPSEIYIPGVPHLQARRSRRPPPKM
ncbi:leguminosin proline-rich group669 secreted peptide [Medicago truncatula]|uniref:Leguminosin proline-rich group669 secreted peptide n=1 Tax=Medicago truncatula TaxID=3880 RepID=A0A072TRG2_MEDTR|nr:leguminosin proline-rich group669 secreted peptide [Medicago truncatula]